MFVRENMTKDPVCITPESTITQTELMVNFFPINFRPINTGIEFSSTLISVYGTAIPINV